MLETPSRVWRRIEAIEGRDMPSLPSLPPFEDSADPDNDDHDDLDVDLLNISNMSSRIHSTPAASAHHTATSTIRPTSSTSSTARFASSIASRSTKSSLGLSKSSSSRGMSTRRSHPDSFNVSMIPSLPDISAEPGTTHYLEEDETDEAHSKESVPDVYLPPEDDYDEEEEQDDISLTGALESVSRTSSPPYPMKSFEATPKKSYDYSVSLKSEAKVRNIYPKIFGLTFRPTSLLHSTNIEMLPCVKLLHEPVHLLYPVPHLLGLPLLLIQPPKAVAQLFSHLRTLNHLLLFLFPDQIRRHRQILRRNFNTRTQMKMTCAPWILQISTSHLHDLTTIRKS